MELVVFATGRRRLIEEVRIDGWAIRLEVGGWWIGRQPHVFRGG